MATTAPAQTPADRLLSAWDRCGSDTRRPSVTLQLAVVQYCADVPGTPVPPLDDVTAVRALVDSVRPARTA
jgi:hypothetical protein